jgi:probable phosphoglycerate mutase
MRQGKPRPREFMTDPVSTSFVINIDGGARGNPGPAGWGVVVRTTSGEIVTELFGAIPHATNNVAEYQGLISALEWCVDHHARVVAVRSDSLLLVQQMKGVYKVKNDGLKPLYAKARLLAHEIGRVTFEHVRRELNKDADRLANLAMDEAEVAASKQAHV